MPSSPLPSNPPSQPRQVIIVGAGVAGLACARELLDSPLHIQVTVLESRQRIGGRILTHWLDGSDPEALSATTPQHDPSPNVAPNSDLNRPPIRPNQSNIHNLPRLGPNLHRLDPSSIESDPTQISDPGRPIRHDFNALAMGRVNPARFHHDDSPRLAVDVGASIMHGCGDDNQLVFKRAIHDRIRAPVVAGSGFYESTEHAMWFDDNTADRIPSEQIVDVHNIFFMASRYMAAVASQSDDGAADMHSIFKCGVSYVCKHLGDRVLSRVELAILDKICARSVGYCSPMASMALMQASAGMEVAGTDAHIGIPYEEDDPPFPGEVPSMTPTGIKQQASRLEKSVLSTQKPAKNTIASRRGGPGDRIVLDGYSPFIIDRLAGDVDVRLSQSVISVSKAYRAPMNVSAEDPGVADGSSRLRTRKRGRPSNVSPHSTWASDPEVAARTVLVSTRSGEIFQGDFVVITVPLGVLREKHEDSHITFTPPLSEEKQEAIASMGMGIHNKIILRFNEDDVFWPPLIPQLNCLDPRFQFFNLHSYGKTGVLLVHVFAESGFSKDYWGLCDEAVVAEVLMVLGGMFCTLSDDEREKLEMEEGDEGSIPSRHALARARTAKLMGICSGCRKPLDGEIMCKHCSLDPETPIITPKHDDGGMEKSMLDRELNPPQNEGGDVLVEPKWKVSWDTLPAPAEFLVTRWDKDPYCLGSYSYMPCGSSWPMIDQLAAPEPRDSPHPYLFFAGEHCSDLGWQCVHGAYETGIRAAREILDCLDDGTRSTAPPLPIAMAPALAEPRRETAPTTTAVPLSLKSGSEVDPFWTVERERALTRALVGYSDVYGNLEDVMDEMAHALHSFKKEPTDIGREEVRELVTNRIHERAQQDDVEAAAFLKFHNSEEDGSGEEFFAKPFAEVNKRPRLVGLNGSKLRECYSEDIVRELKNFAPAVAENQISYRETLRKIAVMIYRKDGGLMTKRCLSEYLRTQEFGNGPQKELFLEKYLGHNPKKG